MNFHRTIRCCLERQEPIIICVAPYGPTWIESKVVPSREQVGVESGMVSGVMISLRIIRR